VDPFKLALSEPDKAGSVTPEANADLFFAVVEYDNGTDPTSESRHASGNADEFAHRPIHGATPEEP
jgi:hypothetical protein